MEKEQIKDLKLQIVQAIAFVTPYVKQIAEEKIIPWFKKKYYERTEAAIAKMLKKLAELGVKTINCTDKNKKARHIVGFKLGYAFVCALEPLVVQAKDALSEINSKISAQELIAGYSNNLIGEDEIPF